MDTFAHAIWSLLIFHKSDQVFYAVLFGVLPDLLSWTIYLFYSISKRQFGPPKLEQIPHWVFVLYGLTHSVFVMAAVFTFTHFFTGIPLFLWAWPIHVLIDIPTHSREYLPTPFLWPFFEWKFPGIGWANRYFMFANYAAIIIYSLFILL